MAPLNTLAVANYHRRRTIAETNRDENMSYDDNGPRKMYKAVCADCGKECEVPFKPTQGRPVYCRDCYAKHKPKSSYSGGRSSGYSHGGGSHSGGHGSYGHGGGSKRGGGSRRGGRNSY